MSRPGLAPADDAIAFAEKVFALLNETRYSTTYKLAVLLALMDLCLERTTAAGIPPDMVTTRQLAQKVIEIYWPHTVPFGQARTATVLRQSSAGQAEMLLLIERFRSALRDHRFSLFKARTSDPASYVRLLNEIEWKLIEMPLPRLQTIGVTADRFIYEIAWDHSIRHAAVSAYQKGTGDFDNRILLKPGVAEYFVRLNGLLRPLIHRQWAAMVAALNAQDDSRLENFLFGSQRIDLSPVREPLWEIQNGRCFYCQNRLPDPRQCHVDHFIPWARYPEDGLANLVAADSKCNGDKSDFLAASDHLANWLHRLDSNSPSLMALLAAAEDVGWDLSADRMEGVSRATYLRLRRDAKLWQEKRRFVDADPQQIAALFSR